jgi:hypothetical protein
VISFLSCSLEYGSTAISLLSSNIYLATLRQICILWYNSVGKLSPYSFNSHWNFKVQAIEKVIPNTANYRLEREDYWIKKLVTKTLLGLNKNH